MYTTRLPRPQELEWLSKIIAPYPVSRNEAVNVSREYGFRAIVTKFLKLFPESTHFANRDDFLTRSEDLEYLISQEREGPRELYLREED